MFSHFLDESKDKEFLSDESNAQPTFHKSLLHQVGAPTNEAGLCVELANLYTEYQLHKAEKKFLNEKPEKVYAEAIEERKHQEVLLNKGEDFYHSAFVDNKIPYHIELVDVEKMKTSEGVKSVLHGVSHALLMFQLPTPKHSSGKKILHQVAVGQDKQDSSKSYFFDPNRKEVEVIGPCDEVYTEVANTIQQNASAHKKDMVVAIEIAPSLPPYSTHP